MDLYKDFMFGFIQRILWMDLYKDFMYGFI